MRSLLMASSDVQGADVGALDFTRLRSARLVINLEQACP